MKKLLIMAVLGALFVMVTAAGVAYASGGITKHGTDGHDKLFGTKYADKLYGEGGTDDINGRRGPDVIWGGSGEDFLRGHQGNDVIHAGDDKDTDEIRCGGGDDLALVSGADHSHNNLTGCETVKTEK